MYIYKTNIYIYIFILLFVQNKLKINHMLMKCKLDWIYIMFGTFLYVVIVYY